MRNYTIKLDSDLGKKLALTSDNFDSAFAWDCRPKYIGFVILRPKNKEALKQFFELGKQIYSTIMISAPLKEVEEMALEYGYTKGIDKAGTPFVIDESLKVLRRQHIDQLGTTKQQ